MKSKNSIGIKPNKEKELYHIFKDLEKHGRTTFSYPDRNKHVGIARSMGIKCKPLVDRNLMIPPLSSTNNHRMTGIQLPKNVEVVETKKGIFSFKRRKNIL